MMNEIPSRLTAAEIYTNVEENAREELKRTPRSLAFSGMGHFAHCIASSGEILSAVFSGFVSAATYGSWLAPTTLGNIAGGVVFVTLLNFGQVTDTKNQDS